ncbi:DUF1360 domain-containing protein [Candidatus Micrarchaeota archaeon]|nr:DUF1360 domain-containing protein [Candidatus Micrarchaeota archaeon]
MILDIILLAIAVEAVVELIFAAGPLQRFRIFLVRNTPFLTIEDYGHLLECKYCVSVWVGLLAILPYCYMHITAVKLFVIGLVLHRLSNVFHISIGLCRDIQINLKLKR